MSSLSFPLSESDPANSPRDIIRSLWRGLHILEVLATEPEGLLAKNISVRCQLNVSTCYHLLNTLVGAGYVSKDPVTQRFMLSSKISFAEQSPFASGKLVPLFQPHLQSLRETTRETTYLSLRNEHDIVVSAIVDSPRSLRVSLLNVGYASANHAMALGKAILAYLDEADVLSYLRLHGLPSITAHTMAHIDEFLVELEQVRARGYATDHEEFADDICCIAAPIFDVQGRVIGSIGLAVPASRYQFTQAELVPHVLATATAATRALAIQGYVPHTSTTNQVFTSVGLR